MAKQSIEDATRANMFMVDPAKLKVIGFDTNDGKEHVLFRPQERFEIDPALVKNIAVHSVKEPVAVRKNGEDLEVVFGVRRTLHAREANKLRAKEGGEPIRIPVIVQRGTDVGILGMMVVENSGRRDDNPMEQARQATRMIEMGKTKKDVAITMCRSERQIDGLLSLLDLHPTLQGLVEERKLASVAGERLAKLKREEQLAAYKELKDAGNTGVDAVTQSVREKRAAKKDVAEDDRPYIPPSKAQLKKLVALAASETDHAETLAGISGIDAIRWIIGQLNPKKLKGLTAAMAAITPATSDE